MTSDRGSTGSAAELQLTGSPVTGKTLNPEADEFQVKDARAAPLAADQAPGLPLEEAAAEEGGVPLPNGDVIGGVEEEGGVEAALVDPQGAYQENGPAPLALPLPSLDTLELVASPALALAQEAAPPAAAVEEVVEGAGAPAVPLGAEANPAPAAEASAENQASHLRTKICDQIEYYFSQENLEKDDYMWSQMDNEHWIAIATIAGFPRLQQLTSDIDLIKQILLEAKSVQVDERVEKVRPVACSRCIIMLREIPETVGMEQVRGLFDNPQCPAVVSVKTDINDTWFITFANENDCLKAYQFIMAKGTFMGKPIRARIKSKVLNRNPGYQRNGYSSHRMPAAEAQVYTPTFPAPIPSVTPRIGPFMNNTQFQAALYGNLPSQLLAWPQPAAAPTPQPTYLDPGQMLNLNGYQATAIRGSGNRHVSNYGANSRNSRNANRQHRGSGHLERSNSESRTLGERGPPMSGGGGSRTSPRSLDGAPISTPPSGLAHSFQGRGGPRGSDPGHSTPLHAGAQPLAHAGGGGAGGDSAPRGGSGGDGSGGSHRRNNFGRRRRDGNDSRNNRQQAQSSREIRMEQQFELESTSFPPLPNNSEKNNSGLSDVHENKKSHSDVVRGGTGRPQPHQPQQQQQQQQSQQHRGSSTSSSASASEPRLSAVPTASPSVATPPVAATPQAAPAHPPPQPPREAPEPTAVPVSHAASAPVTAEPAHHKPKASHHSESKPAAEPATPAPAPAVAATVSAQNVQSKPAPEPAKISYAQMLKRNYTASQNAAPQDPAPTATAAPPAATATAPVAASAKVSAASAEESQASVSAASVVNSGRPGPRDHLQNQRFNSPASHRGGMNGTRREDGREGRDSRYGGRPFSGPRNSGGRGQGRRAHTK